MNGTYVEKRREMKSKERSETEEELPLVILLQEKDRMEEVNIILIRIFEKDRRG